MKANQNIAAVVIAGIFLFAYTGCSDTLSRKFYNHHPRSLQAVEQVWGAPVKIVALDNGIEKRTYAIQTPYTDLKYRYFLIKDDKVLASGITDTGVTNIPEIQSDSIAFDPSDLSKAFYIHHPTTVAHLDKTWGTPLCVQETDNGLQYRVYAINAPYAEFKFRKFIVKDGLVVGSRLSPEQTCNIDQQQPVHDIEINEISHRYYAKHPMSLEAVETVWGRPVSIRKTKNGLEKRAYKLRMPSDAAFAFRFFIIRDGMVLSSGISDTVDAMVD